MRIQTKSSLAAAILLLTMAAIPFAGHAKSIVDQMPRGIEPIKAPFEMPQFDNPDGPFRFTHAPSTPRSYLMHRRLFQRAVQASSDVTLCRVRRRIGQSPLRRDPAIAMNRGLRWSMAGRVPKPHYLA